MNMIIPIHKTHPITPSPPPPPLPLYSDGAEFDRERDREDRFDFFLPPVDDLLAGGAELWPNACSNSSASSPSAS